MLYSNGHKVTMSVLLGLGALGLAGWYYWPTDPEQQATKNEIEKREASHSGFLRSTNASRSGAFTSEETRVIRTPQYNFNIVDNARKAWTYYKEKNDLIANMTNGTNVFVNQATIRPVMQQKPGLLQLPSAEGWASAFGDIANVTYDIQGGYPAETMTNSWRDQYGDAGGFPTEGRPNPVLEELYVGNPWGPGGQLFRAVGNEHRDPGYADNKPTGILKTPRSDASTRLKNRVKFKPQ